MKQLIIVCGLPGIGKSALAEVVARKLKLPLFSVDPIESAILDSGIERSFRTGLAAYKVAGSLAREQLRLGQSVVIDAVSGVDKAKQWWRDLAIEMSAELKIIECVLEDEDVHKQRVGSRVRNISNFPELTWQEVEQARGEYTPWSESHLTIDTSKDNEENVQATLDYIQAKQS